MKIIITGAGSGIGFALSKQLSNHEVIGLTRQQVDLSNLSMVQDYLLPPSDILVNCAATGVGGKIDFVHHRSKDIVTIMNTNLVAPLVLSQKALAQNQKCKIVNITSTNNNRYHGNDLAYSLSKVALANFGQMLRVEYPTVRYCEIRLGLVKTNFNNNRYQYDQDRFHDIYTNPHLLVDSVAGQIATAILSNHVKFIEIAP